MNQNHKIDIIKSSTPPLTSRITFEAKFVYRVMWNVGEHEGEGGSEIFLRIETAAWIR